MNLLNFIRIDMSNKDMIEVMQRAKLPAVIDLAPELWQRGSPKDPFEWNPARARNALRGLFDHMLREDVLKYVKYVCIMDEPNLPVNNLPEELVELAVSLVREVMAEYPGLASTKLSCIYFYRGPFPAIQRFDVVGFDKYQARESIFWKWFGEYPKFKKLLKAGQRTWIIPGGSFGQDPSPFVEFAHNNLEVEGIISFLWESVTNPDEQLTGIKYLPVKELYIEAGKNTI